MSSCFVLVLLALSISQDLRVAAYVLKISPEHTRVSKEHNSVVVKCTAGVEFTGCQFRWWDRDGTAGPLLDFASGFASLSNRSHLSNSVTSYGYWGAGLANGECGISLNIQGWKSWMVSCRVSVAGGGWTYEWMDIYAEIWSHLPNTLGQRVAVVLPGEDARLAMNAGTPLFCCRFHLPNVDYRVDFDDGANSIASVGRHRYRGTGLRDGDCGLILTNVSEADNGPSRGYIRSTPPFTDDQRFNPIIVARRPSAPVLKVVFQSSKVTATCVVEQSRPIAQITWLLGKDIIRQDALDDSPSSPIDEWRWPWMGGAITQTVRFTMTPSDEGKVLTCKVAHVTLEKPLEASEAMTGGQAGVGLTSPRTVQCPIPTFSTRESLLEILCQELRDRTSKLDNSTCPKDEVYELRVRAAGALARAAEVAEEAAKFTARAEEAKTLAAQLMVEAARSHAREKEAWAKNAEEELQFERERRKLNFQPLQTPQEL